MTARRARAGHARTKRAGVASRALAALAALAVVATAASTLVVSQAAGPQGFLVAGTRKATIVVKDTEVGELPKAGSTGIYPYIGAAAVLMTGAMVMTVVTTKRRKAIA